MAKGLVAKGYRITLFAKDCHQHLNAEFPLNGIKLATFYVPLGNGRHDQGYGLVWAKSVVSALQTSTG